MVNLDNALLAVTSLALAAVGFFLKQTWAEIRQLREVQGAHAQQLTEHRVRIDTVREQLSQLKR